jgi:hypothetical protein
MWCSACSKNLKDCTCENKEERINDIISKDVLIYQACFLCKKHYALCKCKKPIWIMTHGKNL